MTRKRAKKLLMALKISRNKANYNLDVKPNGKTNRGVVADIVTARIILALMSDKIESVGEPAKKERCEGCYEIMGKNG